MTKKQKAIDALESISAEILALDPSDSEAIIPIGASLEKAITALPARTKNIEKTLILALGVLQSVYEGNVSDPTAAIGHVTEAVAAASSQLAGEQVDKDSLKNATEMLNSILESSGEDTDSACDAETAEEETSEGKSEEFESEKPDEEESAEADEEQVAQAPAGPAGQVVEGATTLPEDADQDLMGEFIVECTDHISAAEASLLELESNPDDTEQINTIFRAFHTIKGTSGFLGLDQVQRLAHLAENLLDRARDGEVKIKGGYADLALKSSDMLRTMIEGLEGVEPGGELVIPEDLGELLSQLSDPEGHGIGDESGGEEIRLGDILVAKGAADREQIEEAVSKQGAQRIGEVLVEKKIASATDVAKAIRTQKEMKGRTTEATVRVGIGRLDNLINMVGELVIAQSMVAQNPDVADGANPQLTRNVLHSDKIIRELQDLTMSLRMVPLKGTFQKMTRLVRDLARKAGKDVQFVTEGEDTEIDRNMVELLNDPLVHMIRNAVDHGVETPEKRQQDGKSPTGTVCLRAYHTAGNVVLELQDDGKGLDREKIAAKAIEKGLIEPGREMTDSEAFGLIFQAGFSTAEKVTDVSGRGVGMDVVKKGIEALRGRVDVASTVGQGSTFTIRLPLTMAITDAMLLSVGKEHYLLPTVSIEHSFRPPAGSVSTVAGRGEMVMLRGNLLPVFRLHEMFDIPDAVTDPYEALLIAIEGEDKRCALMVDELLGQQQVVIKSLGESLGQIAGISGGSILGDGQVGLILDAAGILRLATSKEPVATRNAA